MKKCTKCGETKPLDEFGILRRAKDGHNQWCKKCKRKQQMDHYYSSEQRRKNIRTNDERWREENPERYKETSMLCAKKNQYNNHEADGPYSPIWVKECIDTGVLFVAKTNTQIRCRDAQAEHERYLNRKHWEDHKDEYKESDKYKTDLLKKRIEWLEKNDNRFRKCLMCGKEYDFLNVGTTHYCSDSCQEIDIKEKRRQGKIRRGDGGHRRRARYYGVEYEPIKRQNVFIRDGWRCQHCGIKVQKKDWMKDNAAELDHILPMSQGGGHLYHNVQTLCKKCNNEKGNKTIGQLRMAI